MGKGKEITILVLVDIAAALEEKSLRNNIYFLDNLRTENSKKEGTAQLITTVNGFYWFDGSQASDIIINWLPSGISSLPLTLPSAYAAFRSKKIDEEALLSIKNMSVKDADASGKLENMIKTIENSTSVVTDHAGRAKVLGIKTLNLYGNLYAEEDGPGSLSYLSPQIVAIDGEAVDKGVLFPAQYGTPLKVPDDWYWSATVDTSKTGTYGYTFHIQLFRKEKGSNSWRQERYAHEGKIRVTNEPKRNGFTQAGIGFLPIA
jgi:hypothetical protein